MHYAEAARFLYALAPRGVSLGLDRVEKALAQRGHPERACPAIVVAGTNGKGSVASMLASVLEASGLRVGLYTSPHLHRLTERFRVNGKPLAQRAFAARVSELAPWLAAESTPALTFFEACTILAFEVFRDARCDVMVLEVGLGGRLDATNVVTPLVSVITSIGMDHADRLGPSLAHIAREKAGILKQGVPAVSGVRAPEALRVIRAQAKKRGAPLLQLERDFHAAPTLPSPRGSSSARPTSRARPSPAQRAPAKPCFHAEVQRERFDNLRMPLLGAYQADNLACAVAALQVLRERGLAIDERALRKGLESVRWPGRLERIARKPEVLLDAAHNVQAAEALATHLAHEQAPRAQRVLVFAVMRDKEHADMLRMLRRHFAHVVFATPATPRALPAQELKALYGGHAFDDPVRAFRRAQKLAGKRGLVVVAGSIFVMAAVRAHLLGLRADPPIAM